MRCKAERECIVLANDNLSQEKLESAIEDQNGWPTWALLGLRSGMKRSKCEIRAAAIPVIDRELKKRGWGSGSVVRP